MSTHELQVSNNFISDIRGIIETAKINAVRSVDFQRVVMYWRMGERIVVEEQQGKARAEYGSYLLQNLAKELEPEYGNGFTVRQLERARQFYRTFPIASALRSQFNWYQYKLLIQIDDPDKREYYEQEALHNAWTGRQLERQINSSLYERLLLSNDKESVLAIARRERIPENPAENNKTILASQYQLYLPTENQLLEELKRELKNFEKENEEFN